VDLATLPSVARCEDHATGLTIARATILSFFLGVGAMVVLFFWAAVPPALHELEQALREFQSYVVNPHVMGQSVGLSPLVTLVSVSVVSILFGAFAVVLAIPFTSAVASLIDVFVLDHDPPAEPQRKRRRLLRSQTDR
jgi:hypothetical protein